MTRRPASPAVTQDVVGQDVVPPTVGAHLDLVDPKLPEFVFHLLQLGNRTNASGELSELRTKCIPQKYQLGRLAHWAWFLTGFPVVQGCTYQHGVRVALGGGVEVHLGAPQLLQGTATLQSMGNFKSARLHGPQSTASCQATRRCTNQSSSGIQHSANTIAPGSAPMLGVMPNLDALVTTTLDNGLDVIVDSDLTLPAVAINLWYNVGSADEQPGRDGFAHLFEHLMFSGTTSGIASGEHLATIEAVGGSANATTSFDRTNYFELVPPGALELGLWLEAERMAHLAVTEESLTTQRDVVKEEKRQRYDNSPYGDLLDAVLASQYDADEPYGHSPIGSEHDLDAASLDDVVAFHDRWYRPSNASLVISGCVDAEEALRLAERYFAPVSDTGAPAPQHRRGGTHLDSARRNRMIVRDVPRTSVVLTWPVPPVASPAAASDTTPMSDHTCPTGPTHTADPTAVACDMALSVLAGGMSSRLVRRLDRELGLVDGVSANSLGLSRQRSTAIVAAHLKPGVSVERFRRELDPLLTELATQPPTPQEMARCRAQAQRDWLESWATADTRADVLNAAHQILDDARRCHDEFDLMAAMTCEQVGEAAELLDPSQASMVVHTTEQTDSVTDGAHDDEEDAR